MVVFCNPHIIDDFSSLLREKARGKKFNQECYSFVVDTVYKVGSSKTDNKAKETQQNCAPPFSQYLSPVGGGKHYHIIF